MIADLNQNDSTQSEIVSKGGQLTIITPSGKIISISPRGGDNNLSGTDKTNSKFGAGSKARGAAKGNFGRRQVGKSSSSKQSSGGIFADAFTLESKFPGRGSGNRDGFFGRFSAQPPGEPHNLGCFGGPNSITVLSQFKASEENLVREITDHAGMKVRLTDKSKSHLTSKHGDALGIDDPLPIDANQKPTKYTQIRTRVNKENKEKFADIIEEILTDPTTTIILDVNIRGIKSRGYYTPKYGGEFGFFVGVHTEGKFAGEIKKAPPIAEPQFEGLKDKNRMD